MKKYICLLLSLFLFIPFVVKAETLTYNVCESGCEYASLNDVENEINNISNLSDKDIIININSNYSDLSFSIGSEKNMIKTLTVNGNNHQLSNSYITTYSNNITLNDLNVLGLTICNPQKIKLVASDIKLLAIEYRESNMPSNIETNLNDVLEIDEISLNNLLIFGPIGNMKIEHMNFKNILILNEGATLSIYNSQLGKLLNFPQFGEAIEIKIYNSTFDSLKYKNFTSDYFEEYRNEIQKINLSSFDLSTLNYDIYDLMSPEYSNTTVYFDKESTVKVGNKLNLVNYLDYYTEDKEIEYTIEDESIAKIENKELIGLKEGSAKVTVTTDEGHVIYRINLVVEKESVPEKIDKMTIKVPITGSKLKLWVLIVGGILIGIALICVYMLIKRKK